MTNTANTTTLPAALTAAGVSHDGTEDGMTDAARAALMLTVCLGCGSTASVYPGATEDQRHNTAQAIDWEACDCCPDADRIIF